MLAAGSSDRLGEPKQLLTYKGRSFLKNMIAAAREAQLDPIVVVLGSHAPAIANTIEDEAVQVVGRHPEVGPTLAGSERVATLGIEDMLGHREGST